MGQDRHMQIVGGNDGNQFRQYVGQNVGDLNGYNDVQNVGNQVIQHAVQNSRIHNVGNPNGLIGVPGNTNQNSNRNGNLIAARAECNATGHNRNQIRCYNCRGVGHFAKNCTVRPRRRDAAYLQTQFLIAQKEEAGIQLQAKEFDIMAAAADLDEIEEVNANCILMANLQQTSTSGTQTDKAPVYDSDGSAEEKSIVSFLLEEKKKLKSDLKTREDELLDKQIQLEKRIKELENILVKMSQLIQTIHMLLPKPDSFYHTEQKMALEETLQLAQESRQKMKQLNKEIKQANYTKINHLSGVFVSQTAKSHEELYFSNAFKMANVSKSISIPNEEFSDDTTPSVARKFLNECDECKFDKISYDKAYKDMKQKIERLQAQLGDLKGKSKDTSYVSDTLNPLSQKLKNEKVELEFQVLNYAKENAHLKTTYKNLFDSISVKACAYNVRASARTKPITVSQPPVISKKVVNSDSNGLSSTGVDYIKTRRPQPRSNTKNDRVPFASKSSRSKNKEVEVEEHHRNLLLFKNKKHMSSACNNIKLDSQNVISKVVCAMCKQCLIFDNHDVCLRNYVNGKTSCGKKQKANVSIKEKQKKRQPKVKKTKKVRFIKRLATPKPSKPIYFLRWSPAGRLFDLKGKIIESSESKSQSDCSNGENACTFNTPKPKIKRFPNSTSLLGRLSKFVYGVSTRVVPST
nr:hypothetical protein [Tanacetum cinerariifolium]